MQDFFCKYHGKGGQNISLTRVIKFVVNVVGVKLDKLLEEFGDSAIWWNRYEGEKLPGDEVITVEKLRELKKIKEKK